MITVYTTVIVVENTATIADVIAETLNTAESLNMAGRTHPCSVGTIVGYDTSIPTDEHFVVFARYSHNPDSKILPDHKALIMQEIRRQLVNKDDNDLSGPYHMYTIDNLQLDTLYCSCVDGIDAKIQD